MKEMTLRDLRKFRSLTQKDVTDRMGLDRSAISRLESKSDCTIHLLERYLAAIGADSVEYAAKLPDGTAVVFRRECLK